jgi:arsenate reductase
MAEWFLRSLDPSLTVTSAGTRPSVSVHPKAIAAMQEIGITMPGAHPKSVDGFLHEPFDYTITVCDEARESCPVFTGQVHHRLHIGFDDPAGIVGNEEQIMAGFRRIRDEIRERFTAFYSEHVNPPFP